MIVNVLRGLLERVTKMFPVINSDHAFIHEGDAHKARLDVGTLAHGASEEYGFKTPKELYVHFKNLKLTSVGATVAVELKRGTTTNPLTVNSVSSATSELTGPHNVNDYSSKTSGCAIGKTPVYKDGTENGELWDKIIAPGSGTNQFQSVSQTMMSDNFEYVMKPDTYYVIEFENLSGEDAASDVALELFWYEEVDG